jgi:hypothetical protein
VCEWNGREAERCQRQEGCRCGHRLTAGNGVGNIPDVLGDQPVDDRFQP